MSNIYDSILVTIKRHSNCLFGIADISYSDYSNKYKCALIIAVPHNEVITLENYNEEEYERIICATRKESEEIIYEIIEICHDFSIGYYIPPMAQKDEENLIAPFSFKFAAVNAGIGWIGKNDILITEEYGPRVRLSAILLDCDIPVGKPIIKSMCRDNCVFCIEACPHKALKGVQWDIKKQREELIDYHLCNTKRKLHLKKHGRKNACGLCMVACPFGIKNESLTLMTIKKTGQPTSSNKAPK